MNKKNKIFYLIFSFLLWLAGSVCAYSQVNISTPTFGFTRACASSSFNSFTVNFSVAPVLNLGPGNQFIVEMSGPTGSFSTPTIVATLPTTTTTVVSGTFSVPTNAFGEGYRLRVRSTNPAKTSPQSAAFPAYYAIHNQPYAINNNVGQVNICSGTGYTLAIDNTGTPASPLYYPNLTYKWYKDYIEIPGQTGSSINVTETGSYYVTTNFGSCVLNSYSNIVNVTVQSILSPQITTNDNTGNLCPGVPKLLTSDVQNSNFVYKWYKDNILIAGASQPTYPATEAGIYHLVITGGGCVFETNEIELEPVDFNLDIDPSATTVVIPGETEILTAITDAINPSYQWYRDNTAISGATQASYNATQKGTYKVVVNDAVPCNITKEASVNIIYPDSFNVAIQSDAAYQSCVSTATTLNIAQFNVVKGAQTTSILNNSYGYSYQWYKDNVAVAGATTPQLNVTSPLDNGSYSLTVTIPDFGDITSNAVTVNLSVGNVIISGPASICEGAIAPLTSNINNSQYTYEWYKDGFLLPAILSGTLAADDAGDYYLKVTGSGCTSQSNTIHIDIEQITVSSTNPVTDVLLPGQNKTLTVTTDALGPEYVWYRNSVVISGASSASYTATQDGEYKVVVTQTLGCNAVAETTFTLSFPTGFTLTTETNSGFTPCVSTTATLSIAAFTAQTPSGAVDVTGLGYQYQWYKNDVAVTGATSATLTLNNAADNGTYKLVATVPYFTPVTSNTTAVNLALPAIVISGDTTLCEGATVSLTATPTDSNYTYQWFKDTVAITGATSATLSADAEGAYYVVVTGGSCMAQSNTLTVDAAAIAVTVTAAANDFILPGQPKTVTVTTNGIAPQFAWYRNNVLLAETWATLTATQDGTYKVVVTQTSGCTVANEATFTLAYPSAFSLVVAADANYISCDSTIASLAVTNFTATVISGSVDVAGLGYQYQWFKDNTAVAGATSATLVISDASQNGNYRLEATVSDFGTVTSNNLTINLEVEDVVINNNTALCDGGTVTLTASINGSGYAYQWYKDGLAVTGATSSTLTTTDQGSYYINVTGGICAKQSNSIQLQVAAITVSTTNPATDVILPGQTKTLSVTTDAVSAQYVWYKNGAVVTGETNATLSATTDGEYRVVVTQGAGCAATAEKIFTLTYPTGFTVTIATNTGYTACTSTTATLSITSFTAQTANGNVDASTLGYTYQWFKNGTAVPGAVASSLVIADAAQNGEYTVAVSIPDFSPVSSNTVAVNIAIPEGSVSISKSDVLCEGSTIVLSSSLTGVGYTYQWYKNGVQLASETASTLTTGDAADYYLIVTAGTCTSQSNTLQIQNAAIVINSSNPSTDVILPGQTKTLTVTTDAVAPQYAWYRNNVLLTETSATLTATQNGEYKVVVIQTSGCAVTSEKLFTLNYPTGFTLTIATNAGYTACTSATATLSITSLTAQTANGNVDASTLGYTYQWFKNGTAVAGAVASSLVIADAMQNGEYMVAVSVPDFSPVISNAVAVNIAIPAGSVSISKSGVLCAGSTIVLSSSLTGTGYTYQWYKNGVQLPGETASTLITGDAADYYLVVTAGTCTSQSNTLQIQNATIVINSSNPSTDVILPGQTKTLTVTTDAVAPQYAWYRNNVLIAETSATLTATQAGEYKVVVTQTSGCTVTSEKLFTLNYPTGFQLTIAADAGYTACTSAAVTLNVTGLIAITPAGNINAANLGYTYQWYKDNLPVPGAVLATLSLNDSSQNGIYKLEVTIPEFAPVYSNAITVNLGFGQVAITAAGKLCGENSQVVISNSLTTTAFVYTWYKNGVQVTSGNVPDFTATETGNYYVRVTNGSCSAISNTVTIQQSDFTLTPASPLSDIIIPGQVKSITVVTDALLPTFVWYRNGIVLAGESTASISATLAGVYKVVVTQNDQCVMTKELVFELVNPSGFALTVAAESYEKCVDTQAILYIAEFKAVTGPGFVNLIGNNYDYDYQWYKNGAIIGGATQIAYTATETGIYTLEVNIPDFGIVTSNGIAVELAFVSGVTIDMDGAFCADGTEVTLFSDVTNAEYLYTWYHNGTSLIGGSAPSITVSEKGSYYLEVSYNGCTITSNTIVLQPYDMDLITISVGENVEIPENTSITVTAGGAESYVWFLNGTQIGNGPSIEVSEPGTYTLVATVGECEVTKQFVVSIKENNLIAIPNLISPNNDGKNDKWSLPLQYLNEDTEVVVYAPDGTIVLRATHYNNSWPDSDFTWSQKNPVYYYTIMVNNKITRRGSITIIQ